MIILVGSKSECYSDICDFIKYIHCMLVREIWKLIHPRVSYSPINKFLNFLYPHAITILLYRMKPRTHIYARYCWQAYFKSIGTLSRIFKNHMPIASDVFPSKNDSSGGKTREASEGVEYDFYFTEYDFCPVFWFLPIVQSN